MGKRSGSRPRGKGTPTLAAETAPVKGKAATSWLAHQKAQRPTFKQTGVYFSAESKVQRTQSGPSLTIKASASQTPSACSVQVEGQGPFSGSRCPWAPDGSGRKQERQKGTVPGVLLVCASASTLPSMRRGCTRHRELGHAFYKLGAPDKSQAPGQFQPPRLQCAGWYPGGGPHPHALVAHLGC